MVEGLYMEFRLLTAGFLMGIKLAVCYDLLRMIRLFIKHNTIVIGAEDFIFWLAASWMVFKMLYFENDGAIRWYIIFGILFGMIIGKKFLGDNFIKVLKKAIKCHKMKKKK